MADKLVPTQRTIVTMQGYIGAVARQWPVVAEQSPGFDIPSKATCALLYAQYMMETGGRDAYGWNVGNSKEVANDGIDYHALRGVWEGTSPKEAARLIASGQATADPSPDHAKSVGAGRVSVIFAATHPASWFSSFKTLDDGMRYHLKLLAKRFAPAWPAVLTGDCQAFAVALRTKGYFTADAGVYAKGMKRSFNVAMASPAYDAAIAECLARKPPPRADSEELVGSGGIIHPPIDFEPRNTDDDTA